MTAASVTVVGADTVARTMHDFADDLRDLSVPNRRAGAEVATAAAQNVRRRTGRLAGSITATVTPDGPTITAGNAGVRYAGPIEGGWRRRNIMPQHYMRNAVQSRADAVVGHYADHVDHAARQIKGA